MTGRRILMAWMLVLVQVGGAWSCTLPLDPKVCVLPETAEETGAVVDDTQCKVGAKVPEEEAASFLAYVDMTGREKYVKKVTKTWRGRSLVSIPELKQSLDIDLNFGMLLKENGFDVTNPESLGLGRTIKKMKLSGERSGDAHFGESFQNKNENDVKSLLPSVGPEWEETSGNTRWKVISGQFAATGRFKLVDMETSFEFDLQKIGNCTSNPDPSGKAEVTCDVPTGQHFYENVCYADMKFEISDVEWTWKETEEEFNPASGTWSKVGENQGTLKLSGEIVRASKTEDGTGGHPGYFYIMVLDKNPAVYVNMTGTLQGPAMTTGDTATDPFAIDFEMVDNSPFIASECIPVSLYYTLAVTEYADGGFSPTGKDMDKLKYPEFKDSFVWKVASGTATRKSVKTYPAGVEQDAVPTVDVGAIGGSGKAVQGPLTHSVSTWNASFTVADKMGFHFSKEQTGDLTSPGGGKLFGWGNGKRLKYFIVPGADGNGNPGLEYQGPELDKSSPSAEEDGFDAIKGEFAAVKKGKPAEEFESQVTGPDADKAKCIGNLGTWEVTDNDPPNVFLAIKDTRYNRVHVFGENTNTLDAGTEPFTKYTATVDNSHLRQENVPEFIFSGGDTADRKGYEDFKAKYIEPFIFHNHPDDANGMWLDEDTQIEFFTWGYDNINTYDPKHGLTEGTETGTGDVCWWGKNMEFGTFQVLDTPGAGSTAAKWFPTYIFRSPNRPTELNAGPCSVEVTVTDGRAGSRRVKVDIFVVGNEKTIEGLEQKKFRTWDLTQ